MLEKSENKKKYEKKLHDAYIVCVTAGDIVV
jgi:hypothetical protein